MTKQASIQKEITRSKRAGHLTFLIVLCCLFLPISSMHPGPVAAASPITTYTFTVNTTNDTHDAHPGDGKCADSTGQCSLRAAIEEGDALPSGSSITITVPKGTYGLTLGTLQLTANTITINGAGRKTPRIEGNNTFGIMSISAGVNVSFNKLTIVGGNASGNGGGIDNVGTLSVSNSTITANKASMGGGIYNGGTLTVSNSTINANSGSYGGGGIYNDGGNGGGTLNVSNSTLSANSATSDAGGGIYNVNYGTVSVSNSTLSANSATRGGGIYSRGYHGGSTVSVSNSTISANLATSGGGIYEDSADVSVSNSTFSGNSATGGDGGAIVMPDSNGGTVSVSNSTFSANSATGKGGAIANDNINGTATLTGTIVANRKGAPNCSGKITDKGYNLDSDTSCGFKRHTDLNKTDPMLGPLGHNGGPTKTMALLQGSKAIDWVALSSCPATDQRGYTRPDGSGETTCDIGAYESSY